MSNLDLMTHPTYLVSALFNHKEERDQSWRTIAGRGGPQNSHSSGGRTQDRISYPGTLQSGLQASSIRHFE